MIHAPAFQWDAARMTPDAAAVLAAVLTHTRPVGAKVIANDLEWLKKGDDLPMDKNRNAHVLFDTHRVVVATKELVAEGLLEKRISVAGTRYKAV